MQKLKMASLIRRKGVDINVWSADRLRDASDGPHDGIPGQETTNNIEPEQRHEPILPYSTFAHSLVMAAGGAQSNVQLLWVSTQLYPDNTIVEIPSQGGKYKATHTSNLQDYSDVVIYELEGDDEHQHI
ncbi:hypothetical protein LASUN_13030 [Lentilactobacillus sunkii]|uniref:Uncharacterized protein n=1 Tax=Lentilactobacillus sunkii TaxID=481719 RepID=A0A1E7XCA0_9LACO|nr:hypothetical protein [Lentilactobacillus sunkii]OFA10753.1 hypothetical protein LASUN_13030 [Lentilactobacillus sunkii]